MTADLHKLSVGRADYYLREIARDREEYLSGQGESPGEWLGGSAAALGLQGVCSPEAFQRVFAWRHPQTGEQLGRTPRRDAMPAWDLVLRPVKDVSVLYGLGDGRTRRVAREAHQVGLEAAVGYLNGQVGTRRGRGGAEHVGGAGLLAVGFTHRTSRAGDPLLHTHLVYGALAAGDDGFVPLDRERVEEQADLHIFGYHLLVRQAVTELVRELGLGWAPPAADGSCEVTGLPARVLQAVEQPCRPLGEITACRLE